MLHLQKPQSALPDAIPRGSNSSKPLSLLFVDADTPAGAWPEPWFVKGELAAGAKGEEVWFLPSEEEIALGADGEDAFGAAAVKSLSFLPVDLMSELTCTILKNIVITDTYLSSFT